MIAIISIATFLGIIWMVARAESCSEALINAVLVVLAGILLIALMSMVSRNILV